ncbi:MAG: hypothetical protein VKL41_07915 [Snowella sp.]|nr:hypothetical protein [Snowella sp.]
MANIDFLADLKAFIEQELSTLGLLPDFVSTTDIDTLLMRYVDVMRRVPPVIQWTVKKSKELEQKNLPGVIRSGLDQFIDKAESGQDLKPHLSKKIYEKPEFKDLMFYDWQISHFHLGTEPDISNPNFIARTGELLFVLINPNTSTMYLIDILDHKFTNQNLIDIIDKNWPNVLDPYTIKGISEIDINPSDHDIKIEKNAGRIVPNKTSSGRVLISMGGGYASDNTSILNQYYSHEIKENIKKIQQKFIDHKLTKQKELIEAENHFKTKYNKSWNQLEFKICKLNFFEKPQIVEIKESQTEEIIPCELN